MRVRMPSLKERERETLFAEDSLCADYRNRRNQELQDRTIYRRERSWVNLWTG